ncbi:MAG: penicillin-binding protein activator, partial [Gammaproteobacteria bacterium]
RVLLILSIPLFLLYGCESTGVRDTPPVSPDSRAESLFTRGSFELAATEYLALSESYPEDFENYRLHAAHAYIEADETDKANLILDETGLPETARDLLFYKSILRAKIELNRRQPARALTLLPPTLPEQTQRDLIVLFHSVRAETLELQEQYPDAIRERIRLASYLSDSDQTEQNTARLWNHLINITPDELDKLDDSGIDNATAWIELARISKSLMSNREQLRQALDEWIEANPRHPANPQITTQILTISEEFNTRPQHIALLLPLSGMYERYAEVIRDGFLSAWFNENEYKPTIRIYDTTAGNIMDVYQTAVDNGADFIVGPLEKEAVRALSETVPIPVRTLALNQID